MSDIGPDKVRPREWAPLVWALLYHQPLFRHVYCYPCPNRTVEDHPVDADVSVGRVPALFLAA